MIKVTLFILALLLLFTFLSIMERETNLDVKKTSDFIVILSRILLFIYMVYSLIFIAIHL